MGDQSSTGKKGSRKFGRDKVKCERLGGKAGVKRIRLKGLQRKNAGGRDLKPGDPRGEWWPRRYWPDRTWKWY